MVARKEGAGAVLTCQACSDETKVPEGAFEAIHEFIQEHRTCGHG